MIEEASNVRSSQKQPQIEEEVKRPALEPIEEDLTLPEAIMHIDEVEDWEDRMNRASYNSHQRSLIAQCLAKKDVFLEYMANGNWEVSNNAKKDGY